MDSNNAENALCAEQKLNEERPKKRHRKKGLGSSNTLHYMKNIGCPGDDAAEGLKIALRCILVSDTCHFGRRKKENSARKTAT
jgi:hypothetical protein